MICHYRKLENVIIFENRNFIQRISVTKEISMQKMGENFNLIRISQDQNESFKDWCGWNKSM